MLVLASFAEISRRWLARTSQATFTSAPTPMLSLSAFFQIIYTFSRKLSTFVLIVGTALTYWHFTLLKAQGLPSPVRRKPYQAEPIFIILFETFFKNMKSVGSQFPQRFLDIAKNKARRPEIPISMLAIVCTAVILIFLTYSSINGFDFLDLCSSSC